MNRSNSYHTINAGAGTAIIGGGGTLAYTGVNTMWLLLAAITLIALGAAIQRLAPRAEA